MDFNRPFIIVIAAAVLGICVAAGGFFIGHGIYSSRMADRYVTVKGLAEKDVKADLAVWNIKFTSTGDVLAEAQEKIEADQKLVMDFLSAGGLSKGDFSAGRINVTDLLAQSYRSEGAQQSRYIVTASVLVRTNNVDLVNQLTRKMGQLIKAGVVLADSEFNSGLMYLFTKLNDIKPEMIAEATRSARAAAEKFAADSNSRVGSIRRASQGMFTVSPRDSTDEAQDNTSIDKRVRVVSTIDYYLE
jgi:hypothetical protein